jgi:hypothetical protein
MAARAYATTEMNHPHLLLAKYALISVRETLVYE